MIVDTTSVWLILAERCVTIRRLRAELEEPDDVELVFDSNDQARVVAK